MGAVDVEVFAALAALATADTVLAFAAAHLAAPTAALSYDG